VDELVERDAVELVDLGFELHKREPTTTRPLG
jgi:hypothetical protein